MYEIALIGRGGQGVVTSAAIIAEAAVHEGRFVQKMPVYAAARRGELVRAFVRIDSQPVLPRTPVRTPDCLILADARGDLETAARGLRSSGALVLNRPGLPAEPFAEVRAICCVDANALSRRVFGARPIPLTGVVMIGAFTRVSSIVALPSLRAALSRYFVSELLQKNQAALLQGYSQAASAIRDDVREGYVREPAGAVEPELLPYDALAAGPVLTPQTASDIRTDLWRAQRPMLDQELCRSCGLCYPLCPEGVIGDAGGDTSIDYRYCKGCGVCADVCPSGAIHMVEES
jgi:pyruvate ferredoxin oxidoreductase gamma subunit